MKTDVEGEITMTGEPEKEEAEAKEESSEGIAEQRKEGRRKYTNETEEDGWENAREAGGGEGNARRERRGVDIEGIEQEAGGEQEAVALSSPAYLYEDGYIGNQNDWYAVDSFFDEWVENDSTQSYRVRTFVHDGTDGATDEESKVDDCSVNEREERDTEGIRKRVHQERQHEAADVTAATPASLSRDTQEKSTHIVTNLHLRRRHVHKQKQQQHEGDGEEQEQQEPWQELENAHQNREAEDAAGEEENKQSQRSSREKHQGSSLRQREKQSRKAEERLKRQQRRLEERRQREAQREHQRQEKMKAQQQDQQIRIYLAGVEDAVLLALKQLLQQPQFLPLKEIVVIFSDTPRQLSQHETRTTDFLFSTTHTTLDIVHGSRAQIAVSPTLLDEEFAKVSTLTRLCPTALCIVCMPHPIQNYRQQLQIQMLQTQQSLVAQRQSVQAFLHPYASIQDSDVAKRNSDHVLQQSLRMPFSFGSSSYATERSNIFCCTSEKEADLGGSSTTKSGRALQLYKHFLVLPLFTETTRLRSPDMCSRSRSSSSHTFSKSSSTPHSATKQRRGELFEDRCTVSSPACPENLVNTSSDESTSGDNASESLLDAPGSCSSHCRKPATTDSQLNKEAESRPTFESLRQQLSNLLGELQGAARVVCLFQGVRASLAVPQPRVDDEVEVDKAKTDSGCCSSFVTLSQQGSILNRCCSCHCTPASGEIVCSCASSSDPPYHSSDCMSSALYVSSSAQKGAQTVETGAGEGRSRNNMVDCTSPEGCKQTSSVSKEDVPESRREEAGSMIGGTHTLDSEIGQKSSCVRPPKNLYTEGRSIVSPGELDEIIATLLIDCGIDCVEPPDAASTADYILTAVKHMRAAQKVVGEQPLRMKKSKPFTAAEEAILAEVAQAATSTIADYTLLPRVHKSPATTQRPRVAYSEATGALIPTPDDAATGPHTTSHTTPVIHATTLVPSGTVVDGAVTTGASPQVSGSTESAVVQRTSPSFAVGRSQGRCEDVFNGYRDVSSFACRLWGKQLVQIPTVTDKVAAAVMRRYKRPAALLQKIRAVEEYKIRAGAEVSLEEEATSACEASGSSSNHSTGPGNGERTVAFNCERHAPEGILVQTELLPLQKVRKKMQKGARDKAAKRSHAGEKEKQMGQRLIDELAEIVLQEISANASHTKSAGTEEDFADAIEGAEALRAGVKVAKIGTARARKIYDLFAGNPAGTL